MAIEIVEFPIIDHSYVSLPEGNLVKAIVNHPKNHHKWLV